MKKIMLTCAVSLTALFSQAQQEINLDQNHFKVQKNYCSAIKNQGNSGTCWSFASLSFMESEIKRQRNIEVDLSEWFVVRNIYPEKARNYVRTEGNIHLTQGGQIHDVLWVIKHKGIVPESVLTGPIKNNRFDADELDAKVVDFTKSIKWDKYGVQTVDWEKELNTILDKNLGKMPTTFTYNNKTYTPNSFKAYLNLDAEDYIQITSFNHQPFFKNFALVSKYNWSYGDYMNLPLDDFMNTIDHALTKGYTVALNTDVTETTFTPAKNGYVEVEHPSVNQALRQELYENGKSRIDHIMHIVGIAENEEGQKYYITKNSWGEIGPLKGYMYISENFIRSKAMSVVLHKKGLPRKVRRKIK